MIAAHTVHIQCTYKLLQCIFCISMGVALPCCNKLLSLGGKLGRVDRFRGCEIDAAYFWEVLALQTLCYVYSHTIEVGNVLAWLKGRPCTSFPTSSSLPLLHILH